MAIKWVGTRENGHYEDDAHPGVPLNLPGIFRGPQGQQAGQPPPPANPLAGAAAAVGQPGVHPKTATVTAGTGTIKDRRALKGGF